MVNITDFMFPDFKLQWLVDEVKKNLPLELDFLHEVCIMVHFSTIHSHLRRPMQRKCEVYSVISHSSRYFLCDLLKIW